MRAPEGAAGATTASGEVDPEAQVKGRTPQYALELLRRTYGVSKP